MSCDPSPRLRRVLAGEAVYQVDFGGDGEVTGECEGRYSKNAILLDSRHGVDYRTLNAVVDAELENLPADIRARFVHISRLIEEFGLENVREPHVKHLQGPLWEMRMRGRDGIARALYVAAIRRRVVVVRVFVKKTQKTPAGEIELALKRAREISR